MEKCQICHFYDRQNAKSHDDKVTHWGQCRRGSPMLNPINAKAYMIEGVWPHVRDDDWCGDWKLAARRTNSHITEVSSGLLPATAAPAPTPRAPSMPMRPSVVPPSLPVRPSALSLPANGASMMPLAGIAMAAAGRGD